MSKDIAKAKRKLQPQLHTREEGKPTQWPSEARPNPYITKVYIDFNPAMNVQQTIPVIYIYIYIYIYTMYSAMIKVLEEWQFTQERT